MKPDAIIFDMDGTLMNNNPYHYKAWQTFYEKHNRNLTFDEYKKEISGRTSVEIFQTFFGKEMTPEEITTYANEKNLLYRQIYEPHIKPVDGLLPLLKEIYEHQIPMCIATSGTPQNVRFMFKHIPIEKYFVRVIDASEVTHGKPAPDIFLKAASYANANVAKCIVFEDSVNGVAAARAANMKVVGVATTETGEALKDTNAVIENYTQINLSALEKLLDK